MQRLGNHLSLANGKSLTCEPMYIVLRSPPDYANFLHRVSASIRVKLHKQRLPERIISIQHNLSDGWIFGPAFAYITSYAGALMFDEISQRSNPVVLNLL